MHQQEDVVAEEGALHVVLAAARPGLGYPAYVTTLIGVSKILVALVIIAPRSARLKEWVYAGVTFDLAGRRHLAPGCR